MGSVSQPLKILSDYFWRKEDMKEKEMTIEGALQELRSSRDAGNESIKLFYDLLSTAHPNVVEYMENQAAEMFVAAHGMKSELLKHTKDPKQREELLRKVKQAALKARTQVSKDFNDAEADLRK
jgi:hypothetical protein